MSLSSLGASDFVSQTLSSILGVLGGSQSSSSTSSSSGAPSFSSFTSSLNSSLQSAASGMSGSSTANLSNQVMGTLLQAQEAGNSGVNSLTSAFSHIGVPGGSSQQQAGAPPHQVDLNAVSQFLQNLGQSATNTANSLTTLASGAASGMSGISI